MTLTTIPGFEGEIVRPGDQRYDEHREVWNAIVDRRPALIARCTSAPDVVAAIRFGRREDLEIAVKSGGHSVLGLSVPEGGLMIDLGPMGDVRIDPDARRARVGGGALLRSLDRGAEPHGLATTAGNVSHTGVGGLTLGGGMGWLARQFGMACDNVERYTVVTADGETIRVSATEEPDLFWGLRGGGGNFGIVTEFEFQLHPISHRALVVNFVFPAADADDALRRWRDLLADAPRPATLTADATTARDGADLPREPHGRPIVGVGFVWVGEMDEARAYLASFREGIGPAAAEQVDEMSYVALQSIGDANHHHGLRRYANGHYLTELNDAAIDAFVSRGVEPSDPEPDWSRLPYSGLQAYGGAIADVPDASSAFSQRDALVEWFGGIVWSDAGEDEERMAAARRYGAAMAPFASGVYVNALADEGEAGVQRAYRDKLDRLVELKRRYDPENVFHLNQNIRPELSGGERATVRRQA